MAKVRCPECKGKGEADCNMEYGGEPHPDNCPICGGDSSVKIDCYECDGTGKIEER